jgi:hypothetical protein
MKDQMATILDIRKYEALLRGDFRPFLERVFITLSPGQPFIPTWHLEAIACQLERVRQGKVRRLIINMPPRSLKSITASVAFPAFVLGHDPSRRIICVSYSGDLAKKTPTTFAPSSNLRGTEQPFQRRGSGLTRTLRPKSSSRRAGSAWRHRLGAPSPVEAAISLSSTIR